MNYSQLLSPLLMLPYFASAAEQKPNIILILVDDMGWGDLGFYHQDEASPRIETPNLEKMANAGVQLRRHYSAAPVSAPARASLFTGLHQGHAEVIRNSNFDAALEDGHTLASVLKAAGYNTALIGKWGIAGGAEHSGSPMSSAAWPTKRGFDYFFGYANHIAGHSHYPKENASFDAEQGCNAVWDGDKVITDQLDGCYSTDLFTARAKKWVEERDEEKPFFLALTLTAPHARLGIPAAAYPEGGGLSGGIQWLGEAGRMINTASGQRDSYIYPAYRDKKAWEEQAQALYPKQWQQALQAAQRHASMVTRVDDAVGDLMQLCRDLKIDENTVIIFTSDNGAHNESGAVPSTEGHPSPKQNPDFFRSYGRNDGIKRDMWDGGLRVPCIVYAPSQIPAGRIENDPSQFHDWMATLADISGIPCPERSDGVSLWPLLTGTSKHHRGLVYSEFGVHPSMPKYRDYAANKEGRQRGEQQMFYFCTLDGRELKAIRTNIQTGEEDFEIYDTLSDEHEAQNLAGEFTPYQQEELKATALRSRRIYDYKRDANALKRSSGMTGQRPYDQLRIPAHEPMDSRDGVELYQSTASCPWVPKLSSLSHDASGYNYHAKLSQLTLPAGTVTEIRCALLIPEADDNWYFYAKLSPVEGSKVIVKLWDMNLIDADRHYIAGELAGCGSAPHAQEIDASASNKRGIPLESGEHAMRITVLQGEGGEGHLELYWQKGKDGEIERIPDQYFRTAPAERF